MTIIWGTLLFATIISAFSEKIRNRKFSLASRLQSSKNIPVLYYFCIAILSLIAGLRSSIGDTGYYMYSYVTLPTNFLDAIDYKDPGFNVLQYVIKSILPHPQSILLITASLTTILIMITLYNYSYILSFSVFLFITSGIFTSSMNGIRQYLVAAILFSLLPLIIQKKKWTYFTVVLLLSTFHSSVFIMIPTYFIVIQKAWSKRIMLVIAMFIVWIIGFDTFFGFFTNVIEETRYGMYVDTFGTEAFTGTNPLRILVAAVPVIMGFIFRKKLTKELENYNIYINFSLLNLIVLLLASYNWIFARLGIYFELYNLILLPSIIYFCFKGTERIFVIYIAGIFYTFYFYYVLKAIYYSSYFLNINRELIGPLTRSFYN